MSRSRTLMGQTLACEAVKGATVDPKELSEFIIS
jgi:hypothetical protein